MSNVYNHARCCLHCCIIMSISSLHTGRAYLFIKCSLWLFAYLHLVNTLTNWFDIGPLIDSSNNIVASDSAIADMFNNHFANVGVIDNGVIPSDTQLIVAVYWILLPSQSRTCCLLLRNSHQTCQQGHTVCHHCCLRDCKIVLPALLLYSLPNYSLLKLFHMNGRMPL